MAFDVADVRGWIVDALESNADWRSRKADEYPDDDRNREAAANSLKLREEVAALPPAEFEGIVSYVNSSDEAFHRWSSVQDEEIKVIAFRSFPSSGAELVESLRLSPELLLL